MWSAYTEMKKLLIFTQFPSSSSVPHPRAKTGKQNAWHSSSDQFSFISRPSASSRHLQFPCHVWLHQKTPFFFPFCSHKGQPRKHAFLRGDSTAFIMKSPASVLLVCLWLVKQFLLSFLFFSSIGFFLLTLSHWMSKNFYWTFNKNYSLGLYLGKDHRQFYVVRQYKWVLVGHKWE